MKANRAILRGALILLLVACSAPEVVCAQDQVETLVCIRHGEKTREEIGQLDVRGLNRSLALPQVLVTKFGRAQFIFAPNPDQYIDSREGQRFCYVRPLATIEPTAIYLDLPVNTHYGMNEFDRLAKHLEHPDFANALVFIAWEHGRLEKFAREEMRAHGGDEREVPHWSGDDFDSIYVLRLTRHGGEPVRATFQLEHQGLNHLTDKFPTPAP